MARSRNIKPGFFTNDVLGELPSLTRLLFAGLWTIADREGRIEDRPKKIRAEILPYDQCDADDMLQALDSHGFIKRYKQDGIKVIQVLAWKLHQNPHVKEAPSTLPAFAEHQTSTIQEQCNEQPLPERAGLIPSLLIPDSLNLVTDSRVEAAQAKPAPTNRGSRLPNDFEPDMQFAVDNGIGNTLEESAKFRDYWNSQPGQKGIKTDWQATWRNWCRNAKPAVRASPNGETAYQRSMREKYEQIAPSIAAKAPGIRTQNPNQFFDTLPTVKPLEITNA